MELFEILKKFKNIEPDPGFTSVSKRAILAMTPREPLGTRRILAGIFETGIAVALAVFFIMAIAGQFSNSPGVPGVAPVQFSVINPDALRAEAQAIDLQIELAKLSYQESTTTQSTPQTAQGQGGKPQPLIAPAPTSTAGTPAAATSTATSTPAPQTMSVDQALEALTK